MSYNNDNSIYTELGFDYNNIIERSQSFARHDPRVRKVLDIISDSENTLKDYMDTSVEQCKKLAKYKLRRKNLEDMKNRKREKEQQEKIAKANDEMNLDIVDDTQELPLSIILEELKALFKDENLRRANNEV